MPKKTDLWDRHTIPAEVLKVFELTDGCELVAVDKDGEWVIGYDSPVMPDGKTEPKSGDVITQAQADAMCMARVANGDAMAQVLNDINWPLNNLQAAVLICMVTDLPGQLAGSDIAKDIDAGNLFQAGLRMTALGGNDTRVRRLEFYRRLFVGHANADAASFAAITRMGDAEIQTQLKYAQKVTG